MTLVSPDGDEGFPGVIPSSISLLSGVLVLGCIDVAMGPRTTYLACDTAH